MRKVHGLLIVALIALALAALVALDAATGVGLIQHAGCASACRCVRSSADGTAIDSSTLDSLSRLTLISLRQGPYP